MTNEGFRYTAIPGKDQGRLIDHVTTGRKDRLDAFFRKPKVNIVVLDSGPGGISVAADLYERHKGSPVFPLVTVTFFNAKPETNFGYNQMASDYDKISTFDYVLGEMDKEYRPDLLLLACNTLSVIYPQTQHSQNAVYPVVGIVETGVDLIDKELQLQPNARVLLFGTKTTIEQGTHRRMLIERGVNGDRIRIQACPGLEVAIGKDPQNEQTMQLIDRYVGEVLDDHPLNGEPLIASLNCTHYGYSRNLFYDAFVRRGMSNVIILDPNPHMADFIFTGGSRFTVPQSRSNAVFASYAPVNPTGIVSISELIDPLSHDMAEAMRAGSPRQ